MIDRLGTYAAAGVLLACLGQGIAGERAQVVAKAKPRVDAPLSGQLRRDPPPRTPARLLVRGPLLVAAELGASTSARLIVEDRGAGGYLDVVQDPRPVFAANPLIEELGGGRYRVTMATSDMLPVGTYRGTLRVRMCAESPCVNPIANAAASTMYRIGVAWANPGEWEMFQRDAAHTGYVPVPLRASRIRKVWERDGWDGGWGAGPSGVTTAPGMAFVPFRTDPTYERWMLSALDSASGSIIWRRDFDGAFKLNAPSAKDGRVYVATTGHEWTYLWSFDAMNGVLKSQSMFETQWSDVLAPTISQGVVYTNGGFYGGGTYAFDANDGMPLWSAVSDDDTGSTPAVRDGKVYYYDSQALVVYDAFDGTQLDRILDPNTPEWHGYTLNSAPMLGSSDHVLALSGNGTYNDDSRMLVNYSPSAGMARWSTARRYNTHPATAHGVIYAGSNNPLSFDAIDEGSGQVIWSWVPVGGDTIFQKNVVLTRNLAFLSTDRGAYAIDLATHRVAWSYPVPGTLSISGDGMLYLLTGQYASGRLLAFRLY